VWCGGRNCRAFSRELRRENLLRGNAHRRGSRTEEGDGLTGGSGLTGGARVSASGERRQRYPFGLASWAAGPIWNWARLSPPGPFYVFISFLPFPFLISYFFHRFCINASNHFKPTL
jgi:hypothetical protein